MSNITIMLGLFIFFALGAICITAAIFSWAFKVNQQLFYQKQIYEQLVHLNNANAAKWSQDRQNPTSSKEQEK